MIVFLPTDMTIATRQNEHENIELLAAQRHLYAEAKTYFTFRNVEATLFAIGGPLISTGFPWSAAYVGFCSFLYLIVDIAL
jgi:hypothetical protein